MVFQNDKHLDSVLNDIGCELLCCGAIVEIDSGVSFDYPDFNTLVKMLEKKGAWHNQLGLHSELSYYYTFCFLCDLAMRPMLMANQVGGNFNGNIQFWDWWRKPIFSYIIERGILSSGSRHSRVKDCYGKLLYDPAPWTDWERTIEQTYIWSGLKEQYYANIKEE